ncbi:MAG: DUF4388 domain-containing protein [Burkholderiales bacterium]|nr:DUF4388 domain-containing protein [Burkholderiales bacterium]
MTRDASEAPTLLVVGGARVGVGRRIATASSGAHALRILARASEIALVAVDLAAPDLLDLLVALVGRATPTSLVVLADEEERRGLGRDRAIVALVPRTASRLEMEERLRAAAALASAEGVGLRTVLRVAARRAETLTLHVETADARGFVRLVGGAPIDASLGSAQGEEALERLLVETITTAVAERETTAERRSIDAPLAAFLADDDEPLAELGEADLVSDPDGEPTPNDDALPEALHLLGRVSALDGVLSAAVLRWPDRCAVAAIGSPVRESFLVDLWQVARGSAAAAGDEVEDLTACSGDEIEVLHRLRWDPPSFPCLLHVRLDRQECNVALVQSSIASILAVLAA